MKSDSLQLKAKNLRRAEAIFWMMYEKPMASIKSFNEQRTTVHFSFGDYKISRAWIAEMEIIKLIASGKWGANGLN